MEILGIVAAAFFQAILKGVIDELSKTGTTLGPTLPAPLPNRPGPSGPDLINKWGRV